jgi:hypothetical protein
VFLNAIGLLNKLLNQLLNYARHEEQTVGDRRGVSLRKIANIGGVGSIVSKPECDIGNRRERLMQRLYAIGIHRIHLLYEREETIDLREQRSGLSIAQAEPCEVRYTGNIL